MKEIQERCLYRSEAENKYIRELEANFLNTLRKGDFTKEELEESCAYFAARCQRALGVINYLTEKIGRKGEDFTATFEALPDKDKDAFIVGFDFGTSTRNKVIAASGGEAKKQQMRVLEEMTIKLYTGGSWKSAPAAALEITPKIVEYSKGRGNLLDSTLKPLEWIRSHIKSQKSKLS